ncbi:MAG: hypothetical protein QOJ99_6097 [Bryobacterales bacterium]|jgi:hypothetical protein|nr:hypothetical protein [Bryobacterales bacterium]
MATQSQIEANRLNAQSSTGPRTDEGKSSSSQNATKFGLFSKANCVRPAEGTEYDNLYQALLGRLQPDGPVEEAFATEIIRATWRLRRCALAEEAQAEAAPADNSQTEQQTSIDRARVQAFGVLTRATSELRRLHSERWLRAEALPRHLDLSSYGVAESSHVSGGITRSVGAQLALGKASRIERSNDLYRRMNKQMSNPDRDTLTCTARNSRCTCGSGRKYKRCCGIDAPPVLHGPVLSPKEPKAQPEPQTMAIAA